MRTLLYRLTGREDWYAFLHPIRYRQDKRYLAVADALYKAINSSSVADRLYCGEVSLLTEEILVVFETHGFVK